MPFNVSYDSESDCLIASIEGEIDFELLEELAAEVVRLSTAHNCRRILNDLSKAVMKLSTLNIYDIPKLLKDAGLRQDCLRAIVVAKDFDDYAFFMTVSKNRGQLVELFRDIDEAKRWLATAGGK
jgi:hypothetical protein